MEILRKICRVIIKPICHLLALIIYRVKVEGFENVPKDTACIICGNHVHGLDAPALVAVVNRRIHFMAKEELWKNIGFRFMAFCFDVFPVKREKGDSEAIKKSLKILKSNQILGMYPEGTRNGMEKNIKPKNGAVNLAIRAGVPIVPFGVSGDFKPFKKITYRFGEPMDFSSYKDKVKDKDILDTLTREVMAKVVELRDGM